MRSKMASSSSSSTLQDKRDQYRTKISGDREPPSSTEVDSSSMSVPPLNVEKSLTATAVAQKWQDSRALQSHYLVGGGSGSTTSTTETVSGDNNRHDREGSSSSSSTDATPTPPKRRRRPRRGVLDKAGTTTSAKSNDSSSSSSGTAQLGTPQHGDLSFGDKFGGDSAVGRYHGSRRKPTPRRTFPFSQQEDGMEMEDNDDKDDDKDILQEIPIREANDLEVGSKNQNDANGTHENDNDDDDQDEKRDAPTRVSTKQATAVGSRVTANTPSAFAEPMDFWQSLGTNWSADKKHSNKPEAVPVHCKLFRLVAVLGIAVGILLAALYLLLDASWFESSSSSSSSSSPSAAPFVSFPSVSPFVSVAPSVSGAPSRTPSVFPSPAPSVSLAPSDQEGGRRIPTVSPSFGPCSLCYGHFGVVPNPDELVGGGETCLELSHEVQQDYSSDDCTCVRYQYVGQNQCGCPALPDADQFSCNDLSLDPIDKAKNLLMLDDHKPIETEPTASPAPTTSVCFLCGEEDSIGVPNDTLALQLPNGRNVTCDELDRELQSERHLSEDDCHVFQVIGSLRCGCTAPPPGTDCWMCPEGTVPAPDRLDIVIGTDARGKPVTCMEQAVAVAEIRGNDPECAQQATADLQQVCACTTPPNNNTLDN